MRSWKAALVLLSVAVASGALFVSSAFGISYSCYWANGACGFGGIGGANYKTSSVFVSSTYGGIFHNENSGTSKIIIRLNNGTTNNGQQASSSRIFSWVTGSITNQAYRCYNNTVNPISANCGVVTSP